MQTHTVICRLKNGKIKKYEVDGVETAQLAREFVSSQVKEAKTVLALVNKPYVPKPPLELVPNGAPPKLYA